MLTVIGRRGCAAVAPLAILMALLTTWPVAAAGPSAGGGSLVGTVSFTAGPVPPLFQGCTQTSWVLDGASAAAVLVTASGATFAGDVSVQVDGGSGTACETTQGGGGFVIASITSAPSVADQLSCDRLSGVYLRHAITVLTISIAGQCFVCGQPVSLNIDVAGVLSPPTPSPDGEVPGVTSSFNSAMFDGAWIAVTT